MRVAESEKTQVERLFAEQRDALPACLYRRAHCRLDASDLRQEIYLQMLRVADLDAGVDGATRMRSRRE